MAMLVILCFVNELFSYFLVLTIYYLLIYYWNVVPNDIAYKNLEPECGWIRGVWEPSNRWDRGLE